MDKVFSLQEAANITGVDRTTLFRWIKAGKLEGYKTKKGARSVWFITQAGLNQILVKSSQAEYKELLEEWKRDQTSGYHTGKPIMQNSVEDNLYGMTKYWYYLGMEPNLESLTIEDIRRALSNIPVDYENKNCHYTVKDRIYKAIMSFYKLLIRKGLKDKFDLEALKENKPKRVFSARKTVLQEDALERLLEVNENTLSGRTEFDVQLSKTLVMLLAFAGLRRKEAINLKMADVDLPNGIIHVIDGKGHKNRIIGIAPELEHQLTAWLNKYRPETKSPHFLIQVGGRPITREVVNKRIQNLAKKAGLDITPHGLRRTFATLMENRGMPWSYMQRALGHSDIKTTQGYVMSDDKKMVEWLKTHGSFNKQQQQPKESLKEEETKPQIVSQLSAKDITLLKMLEEDDI